MVNALSWIRWVLILAITLTGVMVGITAPHHLLASQSGARSGFIPGSQAARCEPRNQRGCLGEQHLDLSAEQVGRSWRCAVVMPVRQRESGVPFEVFNGQFGGATVTPER